MGSDQETKQGWDDKERYALLKGTPEEKVLAWLNLLKTKDGHFKAGVSVPVTGPPSPVFIFTGQCFHSHAFKDQ